MIDRKKVISAVDTCFEDWLERHRYLSPLDLENVRQLKADALALLKQKQEDVVRCKDCKHRPTDPENKGFGQLLVFPDNVCPCQIDDDWYSWMPNDDWFCACGERW